MKIPDPPLFNVASLSDEAYERALVKENCIGSVPVLERPTPELFRRHYFQPNLPVVLRGAMESWPALAKWEPSYLDERLRGGKIALYATDRAAYVETDRDGVMTKIAQGGGDRPSYYIANATIADTPQRPASQNHGKDDADEYAVRPLADDIRFPEVLPSKALRQVNFWAGSDGITTNLHWDEGHTLLALVRGVKEGVLFPPGESKHLYPVTHFDRPMIEIRSHIELGRPDAARLFPRYAHAKYYRFDFRRGDILYIPSTYWHYVRSREFSLAVSFVFTGPRTLAAYRTLARAGSVALVHMAVNPIVHRYRHRLPPILRRGWFADPTPGSTLPLQP
jgi:hypothetical protein